MYRKNIVVDKIDKVRSSKSGDGFEESSEQPQLICPNLLIENVDLFVSQFVVSLSFCV
jgi:hypothetical protein